jgi:hypothetical protein
MISLSAHFILNHIDITISSVLNRLFHLFNQLIIITLVGGWFTSFVAHSIIGLCSNY